MLTALGFEETQIPPVDFDRGYLLGALTRPFMREWKRSAHAKTIAG